MTTALIPHPAYSPASPVLTVRELLLAAACCGLKEQIVSQATHIAALEEAGRRDARKIADLLRRNQDLTKAIHRTACAG